MRSFTKATLVTGLVLLTVLLQPSTSEAQRRFRARSRVFVSASFGYPFYAPFYRPFYSPFYDPFWYGYYPRPYYWQRYPPPPGERDERARTVAVRVDVTPKETQIYVDGYFSGTADDHDGRYNGLRVEPGSHEIVLYLKGYKTVRQAIDARPGAENRLRLKMQPLAAGEANEPPPSAPPQTERTPSPRAGEAPVPRAGEAPEPVPAPTDQPRRRAPRPPRQVGPAEARGFGSLAIRAQPAGAEVLIDGERWEGPEGAAPLVIQVSAGPHRIEVRKDGYAPFSTEVQVRQGETVPLNISLPERQ